MNGKWILVTAGLGNQSQESAAGRVASDARKFKLFAQVRDFVTSDLPDVAPTIYEKYRQFLNSETKGFGYFCWKPEIIFRNFSHDYDGIVWVDAGCELNANRLSMRKLKSFMQIAKSQGYFLYQLDTAESQYTKKSLFSHFPKTNPNDSTGQIQATWLFLHGDVGREISTRWFKTAIIDISLLDLSNSGKFEAAGFVEHRFDQSILSLVVKELGLKASSYRPPAGTNFFSQLRGLSNPIWSSRNRSGISIKNSITKTFNKLFPC